MYMIKLGLWIGVPTAMTLIARPYIGSFANFCCFFILSVLALIVAILPHLVHRAEV